MPQPMSNAFMPRRNSMFPHSFSEQTQLSVEPLDERSIAFVRIMPYDESNTNETEAHTVEMRINETIRALRKARNISQETLAMALGVTMQAVSKWECENSLPDIMLLPPIARFFGISMDELFFGMKEDAAVEIPIEVKDDGVLRVIQFMGRKPLDAKLWDMGQPIELMIPDSQTPVKVEIWGNAQIEGDINGSANAGVSIDCGDVNGPANAGTSIDCGDVNGPANAGASIDCGDISGPANAGGPISCGDINGPTQAGGSIECGDIHGSASAGGNIECGSIENADKIECEKLACQGNITANSINGEIVR